MGLSNANGAATVLGVILCVLAAASRAISVIAQKPALAHASALQVTTAGRMGVTTYAVPALVILMSWLALGEVPGPLALAGGLLCLAGVAVARSGTRREPQDTEPR
ncbi:EamA family transporter [Nocardia sp. NPDC127526]|uniref:EamA family transporter n=1 Tax=Nocardia sp. NPDC127526 TaxID=3345393 RepID=UPI00363CDFC7